MKITGEGLVLGARTFLAKMARDESGAPILFLEDEQAIIAPLATAAARRTIPSRQAQPRLRTLERRQKALAHIHLARASLPQCDEERALRLFVAEELLESETTPDALLKAQGFHPPPLDMLKFNPAQQRV